MIEKVTAQVVAQEERLYDAKAKELRGALEKLENALLSQCYGVIAYMALFQKLLTAEETRLVRKLRSSIEETGRVPPECSYIAFQQEMSKAAHAMKDCLLCLGRQADRREEK